MVASLGIGATVVHPTSVSSERASKRNPMSESAPRTLDSVLSTWRPQLSKRTGARKLLAGLAVYYDFRWRVVIGHGKTTFTNGKDLAGRIRDDCPEGMTPALLLTTQDDVEEGHLRTDDSTYLFVIHIGRYLEKAAAAAAVNYLAGEVGVGGLAAMRRAKKKIRDSRQLDEILEETVTVERLGRWVDQQPGRVTMLQEIVNSRTTYAGGRENLPAARSAARRFVQSMGSAAVQGWQMSLPALRKDAGRLLRPISYPVGSKMFGSPHATIANSWRSPAPRKRISRISSRTTPCCSDLSTPRSCLGRGSFAVNWTSWSSAMTDTATCLNSRVRTSRLFSLTEKLRSALVPIHLHRSWRRLLPRSSSTGSGLQHHRRRTGISTASPEIPG